MSIQINIKTPQKNELAELMNACANLIKASSNESVTLQCELTFNLKEKKES